MARHYGNRSHELLELFESLKDDLAECSQLFEPYPEPWRTARREKEREEDSLSSSRHERKSIRLICILSISALLASWCVLPVHQHVLHRPAVAL